MTDGDAAGRSTLARLLFDEPDGGSDGAVLLVHAGGVDHSLAEVRDRATAVAGALLATGLRPGTPVGVMLPSGADVVAALFGVWRAGGAYVPLNPRLAATDLAHVVQAVEPAIVVTTRDHADRFAGFAGDARGAGDVGDGPPVVVLHGPGERAAVPGGPGGGGLEVRPGRLGARRFDPGTALVQLTSGTTGRPKPVLLTHDGVLTLLDNVVGTLRRPAGGRGGRGDGGAGTAPRSPGAGSGTGGGRARPDRGPMPNLVPVSLSLWAGIYQVLFARRVGAPVVVMEAFDPVELARLVARFGIRSTVLPPAAMTTLVDDERVTSLEPLRYVRSITAPLSPLQARRFHDRFGVAVLNCYGQTEIGGEIIGWSAADWKAHGLAKLGAVGRPHAGVQVRVAEETGELQVRTPALAAGYATGSGAVRGSGRAVSGGGASGGGRGDGAGAGDPDPDVAEGGAEAAGSGAADLGDRMTGDGWFRTGDVGRIDADGFVWVDGRLGDMINRGGFKVFPGEVEEVLRLSPHVADVAVAGVPDERLGEVPWAFVVPAAPAAHPPAAGEPVPATGPSGPAAAPGPARGAGAGPVVGSAAGPVAAPGPDPGELAGELAALCRQHLAPYKVPVRFETLERLPRNEVGKVLPRELVARAASA